MRRMISLIGCLMLTISLGAPSALAVNKVLSLDGDGDYVLVGKKDAFNTTTLTMELGFNIASDKAATILWNGDTAGGRDPFWLYTYDGRLYLRLIFYGVDIYLKAQAHTSGYHHIAFVIDDSTKIASFYLDGILEDWSEFTGTSVAEYNHLAVGAYADGGGTADFTKGVIDEVRFWNVARTQKEIQDNMDKPLENPDLLENLVGYWNFDSGTADDLSQYGNDGILKGDAYIADVIYVSPDGSPTGDGTKENPYDTIQRGIDETRRNDIVQVLPGTYEENITLYSDLIVLGSGAEATTIMAASGNIVTANNVHNISLSGFTIDGQGSSDNGILCSGTTSEMEIRDNVITNAIIGVQCLDSVEVSIEGNTIYQSIAHGIYCAGTSVVKIAKNNIDNNSIEANGNHGIVCEGQTNVIINENLICHNWRGISCCGQNATIVIEENEIQANDYAIYCCGASQVEISSNDIANNYRGIVCRNASKVNITENLIRSNNWAIFGYDSSYLLIARNIIRHNTEGGIYCGELYDDSFELIIGGSLINANQIIDNTWRAVWNRTEKDINATYNYWGTTDESEISAMMKIDGEGSIVFKPFINTLDEIIADVSGDGTISALDAALILQYVIGLIDKFPATSPISQASQKYISGEISIDELDRMLQKWGYPSVFKLLGIENQLLQNYPNPFNPETWIPFKLAQSVPVTINIYDTKGQLIRTLHIGNKGAGVYVTKDKSAYWDGMDYFGQRVSSGVYYYTLQAGEFRATRKMVILK